MHASTTEKPGEATLRRLREERAAIAARLFDQVRGRPMATIAENAPPAQATDLTTIFRKIGDES